ncbi:hypothetical protein Aph01nite_15920 [Acrocarpospora phusangensis]|uniref:Uncharacterized protein n=2 Tax=Acrocarpospora phusangensis TaxID=1070424 RepID=A0A919UMF4_9ACTN|nr:hypothetical protein Aph01nite_15920 [Acrocarpospora phusangensis]
MAPRYQIRADYDACTIVVYQAYSPAIADAALQAGRLVAPFSGIRRNARIAVGRVWLISRRGTTAAGRH